MSTTALAPMPSPRPKAPSPSKVVALTETARAHHRREFVGHRGHVQRQLWSLGHDRHVGGEDAIAVGAKQRHRLFEQLARRDARKGRIVIRKVAA